MLFLWLGTYGLLNGVAWVGGVECPSSGVFVGEDVQNGTAVSVRLALDYVQGGQVDAPCFPSISPFGIHRRDAAAHDVCPLPWQRRELFVPAGNA